MGFFYLGLYNFANCCDVFSTSWLLHCASVTFLVWEFSWSLGSCVLAEITIATYELDELKLFIKQQDLLLYSKLQCNDIFLYLESS